MDAATRRKLAERFGDRAASLSTDFDRRLSLVLDWLVLLAQRPDMTPDALRLVRAIGLAIEHIADSYRGPSSS